MHSVHVMRVKISVCEIPSPKDSETSFHGNISMLPLLVLVINTYFH